MSAVARFPGTKSYANSDGMEDSSTLRKGPRLSDYMEYQLETAREAVEEEIAASAFVRGAWREMRRKTG